MDRVCINLGIIAIIILNSAYNNALNIHNKIKSATKSNLMNEL